MIKLSNVYIKRLKVYGVKDSQVDFTKGLNIIVGPSDTGKTVILESIDFAFGSKNKPKCFLKHPEYTNIEIEISIDDTKKIIINRSLKTLECTVEYYDGDTLEKIDTIKDPSKMGNIVLEVSGVKLPKKVPSNKDNLYKNLTGRSLKQLWYLDEEIISDDKSILIDSSNNYSNVIYNKSGIYYLLTGNEFDPKEDNKDILKEKSDAKIIVKYLNNELVIAKEEIERCSSGLNGYNSITTLNKNLDELSENIDNVNNVISRSAKEYNDCTIKMLRLNQCITENEVTVNRFMELISQYDSDIKRLDLMLSIDGGKINKKSKCKCPVCNQPIVKEDDFANKDILIAEKKRIIKLKDDLKIIVENKKQDLLILNDSKKELAEQIDKIKSELKTVYYPMISKLKEDKDKILETIQEANAYEYAVNRLKNIKNKIIEQETILSKKFLKCDVSKYFDEDFIKFMEDETYTILKSALGNEIESVSFDIDVLDLNINGELKSSNNGQGYRSLINSATALAFRKYMCTNAKYPLKFMLIDKPLKEFDDESNDANEDITEEPNTNKSNASIAIFNYLVDNQDCQMIIVENTNRLFNKKELIKKGANVITFSRKNKDFRRGFLLDLKVKNE